MCTCSLRQVLESYASSSYGDATFTQWALLMLRTAEPEPIRLAAWASLEDIAARLAIRAPGTGTLTLTLTLSLTLTVTLTLTLTLTPTLTTTLTRTGAALEAWRAPATSARASPKVLQAFERALLEGRLARADHFLYRLALHHLSAAAFASPPLLHRLLASLPAAVALDLCCCTDLDAPATLPSRAATPPAVPEARRPLLRQLAEEEKDALALPPALVAAFGLGTVV